MKMDHVVFDIQFEMHSLNEWIQMAKKNKNEMHTKNNLCAHLYWSYHSYHIPINYTNKSLKISIFHIENAIYIDVMYEMPWSHMQNEPLVLRSIFMLTNPFINGSQPPKATSRNYNENDE